MTSKVQNRQLHLVCTPHSSLSATGFGEEGHDAQWPNGARIAVSFVLNYEEGGERNILDGDGTSEPYLWEKGPSGGGREHRHLNGEQDFEYGSRCGAWRIHRLMKEFRMEYDFVGHRCRHGTKSNFCKSLCARWS